MKFKSDDESGRSSTETKSEKMTGIVKPVVIEQTSTDIMPVKGDNSEIVKSLKDVVQTDGETEELTRNLSLCQVSDNNEKSENNKSNTDNLCLEIADLKIDEGKDDEKGLTELLERGPNGGRPTAYSQDTQQYAQMGYKPTTFNNFDYGGTMGYQQMGYNLPVCGGKRTRDSDEQPYKYNRPIDIPETNNLNDLAKEQNNMTFSKVSAKSCSGGQVIIQSPDLDLGMPQWSEPQLTSESTTSGEFDLMKLMNQTTGSYTVTQTGSYPSNNMSSYLGHQAGNNYLGNQTGSSYPGNQTCYPGNQSMNILGNTDSFLERTQLNIANVIDKSKGWVADGDTTSEGYSSGVPSPFSDIQDSPSPYSPPAPLSVDSGVHTSTVPSPSSQFEAGSPSNVSMFSPPSIDMNVCNESPSDYGVNFDKKKNADPFTENSRFIDDNLHQLKDVMDTIADIMQKDQIKQRKPDLTSPMPPCPQSKNIPTVSVPPNRVSGPALTMKQNVCKRSTPQNNLPMPVEAKTGGPNTLGMVQNRVPGISQPVCNQGMAQPVASNAVSTGQIVIIQAQPQPTQAFLVVAPPPQSKAQTKYKPIRPRIQPNPTPAKDTNMTIKNIPTTVPTRVTRQPDGSTKPTSMVAPVMAQQRPQQQLQNAKCVNQLNIARRLLATLKKEELEEKNENGDTYIHMAVHRDDKYMVQALLERIDRENLQHLIDTQNLKRRTPLYLAVCENQPEIIKMLISHGADVNLLAERVTSTGQKEVNAAIHYAATYGQDYLPCLESLLTAPELIVDIFNSDGCTALHCAILEHNQPRSLHGSFINSKPVIEALVKAGADPNAQDKKSGKTAFMYALETRDYSLVETLLGLVDPCKVRAYFRTQAFDGRTCVKIMESQKSEFPRELYDKLTTMLNSRTMTYKR